MSQLAFTYEVASWQVRVHRRLDGPPMGGGMYCPDGHVITCAHVVSPAGQRPDGPVYVSFQHARRHEPIAAVVADNGWWPASGEGELYGDVAVLRLTVPPPQEAAPAPLRWLPEGVKAPHSFHTYGYPQPHVLGGVPMRGTIVGYAGQEWLSLLADPDGQGWRPGFSGSPVWDVQQGGVVGIVVVHDSPRSSGDRAGTDGARNAYAIRMEVLGEYWPALKPKIVRALPTDSERLEDLLEIGPIAGELPTVAEASVYALGVARSRYVSAENPEPPYVPRARLDAEIQDRLDAGERFIVAVGDSKSGKSRSMAEALRRLRPLTPGLLT